MSLSIGDRLIHNREQGFRNVFTRNNTCCYEFTRQNHLNTFNTWALLFMQ